MYANSNIHHFFNVEFVENGPTEEQQLVCNHCEWNWLIFVTMIMLSLASLCYLLHDMYQINALLSHIPPVNKVHFAIKRHFKTLSVIVFAMFMFYLLFIVEVTKNDHDPGCKSIVIATGILVMRCIHLIGLAFIIFQYWISTFFAFVIIALISVIILVGFQQSEILYGEHSFISDTETINLVAMTIFCGRLLLFNHHVVWLAIKRCCCASNNHRESSVYQNPLLSAEDSVSTNENHDHQTVMIDPAMIIAFTIPAVNAFWNIVQWILQKHISDGASTELECVDDTMLFLGGSITLIAWMIYKQKLSKNENVKRKACVLLTVDKGRKGNEIDVENLKSVLGDWGYPQDELIDKPNATKQDMIDTMEELATRKEPYDGLLIIICCHGVSGEIIASDGKLVNLRELKECVNNKNAEAFRGAPKIFIINACRGDEEIQVSGRENSFNSEIEADVPSNIPQGILDTTNSESDFYTEYSTVDGFETYRHIEKGAYFIRALLEVWKEHFHDRTLVYLMSETRKKLMKMSGKYQVSETSSTLTHDVFRGVYVRPEATPDGHSRQSQRKIKSTTTFPPEATLQSNTDVNMDFVSPL